MKFVALVFLASARLLEDEKKTLASSKARTRALHCTVHWSTDLEEACEIRSNINYKICSAFSFEWWNMAPLRLGSPTKGRFCSFAYLLSVFAPPRDTTGPEVSLCLHVTVDPSTLPFAFRSYCNVLAVMLKCGFQTICNSLIGLSFSTFKEVELPDYHMGELKVQLNKCWKPKKQNTVALRCGLNQLTDSRTNDATDIDTSITRIADLFTTWKIFCIWWNSISWHWLHLNWRIYNVLKE